jgi:hypothetical protein
VSSETALACEQEGCPFAVDGRCLEGLPDGDGCPHLKPASEISSAPDDATELTSEAEPHVEQVDVADEPESEPMVELGGEDSMTVAEADAVAAKWGASVVLVAGEYDAGKTTVLAELYAQFLREPFGGWSFAGSDCLIALDRRYDGARGPGPSPPTMAHTVDEEMRLLDLRLRKPGSHLVSLLLSDIQGEFVHQVIEGASVKDELPIAARSDRCLVVIDGQKLKGLYEREDAMTRARILIGALTDPGGLPKGRPLAILLTKNDCLDEAERAWFAARAEQLTRFAQERGTEPALLITAARPAAPPHRPEGLESLLAWLVSRRDEPGDLDLPRASSDTAQRSFWRLGESNNA